MISNQQALLAAAEAILFASGDPIEPERIGKALSLSQSETEALLTILATRYQKPGSGIQLLRLGDRVQLTSQPQFTQAIQEALQTRRSQPLSQAALEVLAVVAYHQPVTKSYIEEVRGTDSSSIVNSLAAKGLIEEAGRLEVPGRPILYRTADAFLRCFQLSSLEDLPPLDSPSHPFLPERAEEQLALPVEPLPVPEDLKKEQ